MKKVLITGSGTGFGHEVAMRLAEKGFDVIASVEIYAQVQTLKREAAARGVSLQVEKLDVTNDGDRRKALAWNVEILVNNAGVLEGGSVVDIPALNMRREFEVNVVGPLLLIQGIRRDRHFSQLGAKVDDFRDQKQYRSSVESEGHGRSRVSACQCSEGFRDETRNSRGLDRSERIEK